MLQLPDALECTLVLAAGAVWLLFLTPASGGFHDPSTAVMALALLPALLAVRPWRWVSGRLLLFVALAAAGALLVLLRTPTGWEQADSPAGQVLGLIAVVVVAAFTRTPGRRRAVVAFLLAAVALQFGSAWKAWQGSGDPNHLMVGTFYWHNQLGIWMTALGLVATAHAVGSSGRSRWVAGLFACVSVASVALTTSRTCLGLLVLGLLAMTPMVVRSQHRRRSLGAVMAVPAGGVLLLLVLTSSLFFARPWSGLSAVQTTANNPGALGNRGTSSLATNGGDRGRWTAAALTTWTEHPILGDGYGSFRFTVGSHVPVGSNISAFVHNGYAEALTSGGIAFGLPFLGVWLLVAVAAARRYLQSWRRTCPERPVFVGAALAAGVLLVHSAVDFDWHYPSLLVLLGVVGGMLLTSREPRQVSRGRAAVSAVGLVLVTMFVATASLVEHHGRQVTTDGRARTAQQLLDTRWPGTDDPRVDFAALQACLSPNGSLAVPVGVARRAVAVSQRAARLDPQLRDLRVRVAAASR